MSQYDEAAKINIAEELKKGKRVIEARSLLPDDVEKAGDASYHAFETRFRVAQVSAILLALGLAGIVFLLLIRRTRGRNQSIIGQKANAKIISQKHEE